MSFLRWQCRFVEEIKQFSFQHRFRKWDTLNGENHKARFGMSIASLGNVNLDGKDGESPGGYQGEWVRSSDQAYLERSSRTVTCGDGIVMQEMSWRDDVYLWEWPNIAGHHCTLLIAHFVQLKHSKWCLKYSSDTDKYLSKKIVPTFLLVQSKKFLAWLHFCFLSSNIKKWGMSCGMISAPGRADPICGPSPY